MTGKSGSTTLKSADLLATLCEDEVFWEFFKEFDRESRGFHSSHAALMSPLFAVCKQMQAGSGSKNQNGRIGPVPISKRVSQKDQTDQHGLSSINSPAPLQEQASTPPTTMSGTSPGTMPSTSLASSKPFPTSMAKSVPPSAASPRRLAKTPSRSSFQSSRESHDIWRDANKSPLEGPKTPQEEAFDALLQSGRTMKVSLTPSRLKTYEVSLVFHVHL